MAKFALLFIAIFCIVQLSLASRVPRENEAETTTESLLDSIQKKFNEGFIAIQKGLDENLTKEKAEAVLNTITEGLKTAQAQGQEILSGLQSSGKKDAEKKD